MRQLLLILAFLVADAAAETTVHYIANAGVMVTDGRSKILFDPLFETDFGQYYLPPDKIRAAILDGAAPFDAIDAVFISHVHADHFLASDILSLMRRQPALRLYASDQVAETLREQARGDYEEVFERVAPVSLAYRDKPVSTGDDAFTVEAVRIPHSGWPDTMTDIENIAFRVTLAGGSVVVHLGDADVRDEHYARDAAYWAERRSDVSLPPYWYFLSRTGRGIIESYLRPRLAIGVHVPRHIPSDATQREARLGDVDLFTRPGESRTLSRR